MNNFIKGFCTYDFTEIIHSDDRWEWLFSDESDIEINLKLTKK